MSLRQPASHNYISARLRIGEDTAMLKFPHPYRVELPGPGPFETPVVQAALGLTPPVGETRTRIRLLLQDGRTLLVPIDTDAARELLEILERTVPDEDAG
jgi:hypothetical protein